MKRPVAISALIFSCRGEQFIKPAASRLQPIFTSRYACMQPMAMNGAKPASSRRSGLASDQSIKHLIFALGTFSPYRAINLSIFSSRFGRRSLLFVDLSECQRRSNHHRRQCRAAPINAFVNDFRAAPSSGLLSELRNTSSMAAIRLCFQPPDFHKDGT